MKPLQITKPEQESDGYQMSWYTIRGFETTEEFANLTGFRYNIDISTFSSIIGEGNIGKKPSYHKIVIGIVEAMIATHGDPMPYTLWEPNKIEFEDITPEGGLWAANIKTTDGRIHIESIGFFTSMLFQTKEQWEEIFTIMKLGQPV